MMARFVSILFITLALAAEGRRQGETKKADEKWDPYAALQNAFRKQGYNAHEVKAIQDSLWKERINTKQWPFTDPAKELTMSVTNVENTHAGAVSEAITKAGGDPMKPETLTAKVYAGTSQVLSNTEGSPSSLLQSKFSAGAIPEGLSGDAARNFANLADLSAHLSMEAGQVAANSAELGKLSTAIATNSAWISSLSGDVATLAQATAPMINLASEIGVSTSTLASLSLAGAFVGPMMGVIALVYAAWPEEEVDPWLQVESRVAQMLSEKFDSARRKRLGNRQRRYVKQFSRCSQAWIQDNMAMLNGVAVPRWLKEQAEAAKKAGGTFDLHIPEHEKTKQVPSCMSELEGHMSLERDEWFGTDKGSMSGLFMPFANMHTQILSILADSPFDAKMNWPVTLRATSAEYGAYMVSHLKEAWSAHVCRSMRLRQSRSGLGYWKFQFTALREVHQPNAAVDCSSQCNSESGWCNFCGGKNDGACCKHGDGGVCKRFDVPVGWHGGEYHACVHVGCIQDNTMYDGKVIQKFEDAATPEQCRQLCLNVPNAALFTSGSSKGNCLCLEKGAKRHQETKASSGPVKCTAETSLSNLEDDLAQKTEELTKVPMEEVEPCTKSEATSTFAEVEENQADWQRTCYEKVATVMTAEFNTFYQRFAKFVDQLSWKAGCAGQHSVKWEGDAKAAGFNDISLNFNGGSFADCNWSKEEKLDDSMWIFDETRSRGWTGSSKVIMDIQKTVKMQYPRPSWVQDLVNSESCLKKTAAGKVDNPDNDQSAAVGTIMDPMNADNLLFD